MTTLERFKIPCITDNKFEYVWKDDGVKPTKCPENSLHTIDSGNIVIVEKQEQNVLSIKQEEIPTVGKFSIITLQVNSSANTTSSTTWFYEKQITALLISFQSTEVHKGDIVNMVVGENTPVGILISNTSTVQDWVSQDYLIGDIVKYNHTLGERIYTCIQNTTTSQVPTNKTYWRRGYELNATSTVAQNSDSFHLKLSNGVDEDYLGLVLHVNKETNKTYTEFAPTHSFNAGSLVMIEDHIIEDYEIGEPGLHRVGEGSMGGASIPPDTIVKVYYTNNSNVDKTLIGALEFYK